MSHFDSINADLNSVQHESSEERISERNQNFSNPFQASPKKMIPRKQEIQMISPTSYGSGRGSFQVEDLLGQTPFFDRSGMDLPHEKIDRNISSLSGF